MGEQLFSTAPVLGGQGYPQRIPPLGIQAQHIKPLLHNLLLLLLLLLLLWRRCFQLLHTPGQQAACRVQQGGASRQQHQHGVA